MLGFLGILIICPGAGGGGIDSEEAGRWAREIYAVTGIRGGVVVHLGSGDGRLTKALRINDRYTVQGLEEDSVKVAQARSYVQEKEIYGPVSVEQFSGTMLPYTDNLINLIVVQKAGKITKDEMLRVVAPEGAICVQRIGKWEKICKPRPGNIDEWGHFLHDAGNNAVANDTEVGLPRSLQWVAEPLWLRSHETPSGIEATVSAQGRLFYIFDEGLIGITDERLPDRWSLVCRDAFNGKLLWKRSLKAWGWREWNSKRYEGQDWTLLRGMRMDVPFENQRRIVAVGDRVYTTLAFRGAMSILDATTGDVLNTIEETKMAGEILVSNGRAVVYADKAGGQGTKKIGGGRLVAIDAKTGKVIWQKQTGPIQPLTWVIDGGRVIYLSGKELVALDLNDKDELWKVRTRFNRVNSLLAVDDTVVMQDRKNVAAFDAAKGELLWQKEVVPLGFGENKDLFVVEGLVYRGMLNVDDEGKPNTKSSNALVVGWNLRSGEEKKRIMVKNLRSPEHHHRCYRNKATVRYLISSFEGAEFLDFQADNHGQNNWLRGACMIGMMPCNGMLYVPPDQCFCQPGGKLLGYAALTDGKDEPKKEVADEMRLEKGVAYGKAIEMKSTSSDDWPTFRHDQQRSGATYNKVASDVSLVWKTQLNGRLTAPVVAGGKLFVARPDGQTLLALDSTHGKTLWEFVAGGRIDSPPTIYQGMVLVGSKDGYVYCLRAADGELVWRFLAAPVDRRICCFDQIESKWPVHGSVLIANKIAYFTAGRSTYVDGGIRVYGLEPATGKILYKCVLEGPHRDVKGERDFAFYVLGANSDVLVSQGGFIYMRQKKMTPELQEVNVKVLSSKGAQDLGLHVFSTASLLDDSWYNRTYWMYSQRWPGFQLANQAPKTGQLLVVGDEKTYAVRVFYRRNIHSTMFFPGREGYLLFADYNTTEPQIVGEEGAQKPVKWLPQSDYQFIKLPGHDNPIEKLGNEAFGLDKMIGYTRGAPPVWKQWLPVRIQAMVKAGDILFVAGAPDELDPKDPYAAFEGRKGGKMVAVSAKDGKKLSEIQLEYPPVFDGMIAAEGKIFITLKDGSVGCWAGK